MSFREIIWPSKWKVLVALLIPLAFFGLLLAAIPNYLSYFASSTPIAQTLGVLMLVLIGALIYYPMACGLVYLYRHFSSQKEEPSKEKHKGKEKEEKPKSDRQPKAVSPGNRDLLIAVILILIFNPFTYTFAISTADYVNLNVLNYPCGVEVVGYSSVSPARDAMMVTQEVITMADGQKVDTTQSLTNVLSTKHVNDTVVIQTNIRVYNIKLAADPATGRPVLGIITRTLHCPAGYVQNQTATGNAPKAAFDACMSSCIHTRDAGDTMDNGPCLLDPIPIEPDWVCDVAHNPRQPIDNNPNNQCQTYLRGQATHFIELDTQCRLIKAV
ncbi:MAG: hypothetical protein NTY20_03790 [Candidatus Aenigmarchaeota archaeon]|nr:hypothetical protein [Candidatus Aenigmarchaeota archaeon]